MVKYNSSIHFISSNSNNMLLNRITARNFQINLNNSKTLFLKMCIRLVVQLYNAMNK